MAAASIDLNRQDVGPDTPLRLSVAASIAYPDGSMSAAGLRREANRGRLDIERVAGRDYTTLRAIEEMRRKCRVQPKARASISESEPAARRSGSSETARTSTAQAALNTTVRELRERLKATSRESTGRASQVVPIR